MYGFEQPEEQLFPDAPGSAKTGMTKKAHPLKNGARGSKRKLRPPGRESGAGKGRGLWLYTPNESLVPSRLPWKSQKSISLWLFQVERIAGISLVSYLPREQILFLFQE